MTARASAWLARAVAFCLCRCRKWRISQKERDAAGITTAAPRIVGPIGQGMTDGIWMGGRSVGSCTSPVKLTHLREAAP